VYAARRVVCSLPCSGSESGSYFRLIDFVYHTTLGLSVIKKKKKKKRDRPVCVPPAVW